MKKCRIPIRSFSIFILCMFSFFVILPASVFAACPEEMTSYWKLDGELNPPYINEIDPDFDGECRALGACPTSTPDGAVGEGAQVFNSKAGTGINIPARLSLDAPFDWGADDSFTIEFWIKRAAGLSGIEVVVGRDDASTNLHWWIGVTEKGRVAFQLLDEGNQGPAMLVGSTVVADGQWHHVAAVRDADQDKNLLYVDGVLDGFRDHDYSPLGVGVGFKSTTAALNIGWLNLSPNYYLNGVIDEVALYDVALPATTIKRHYVLMKPYCEVSSVGVFRNGNWYLDANGNGKWDPGVDLAFPAGSFGLANDKPITGDWNGDGNTNVGVFRNGIWYLDANGNGKWDPGVDITVPAGSFGLSTDIPITGDWNGDGNTNVGVFRNGVWYLDANGNGKWDPGVDITVPAGSFGLSTDIPITGDWNGDGITNIGVFRNGAWYLDFNGNGKWDPGVDLAFPAGSFGLANDKPITGDWNGDGNTNVGVFRNGAWYLDANGNGKWDPGVDITVPAGSFGLANDKPITGVW
jgi:hypothetical protein